MIIKIVLFYYIIINFLLFIMMAVDKRIAIKGTGMRIPEKTLLCLGFFGGAIGGFAGMHLFRHKTRKLYFTVIFMLGLIVNAILLYYYFK